MIKNENDEHSTIHVDYEETFNKMIDDSEFENPLIIVMECYQLYLFIYLKS